MAVTLTLQSRSYVSTDANGYGYLATRTDTGLPWFWSMLTDLMAEMSAATAVQSVAPGSVGNALVSNGTNWVRSHGSGVTVMVDALIASGSIESTGALVSATDQTGAAMDYDAVNGYAQITAKASGVGASLGLRFRAVVAGVLTTLLSFAPGSTAAAFAGNLSAQAVTATSGGFTGQVTVGTIATVNTPTFVGTGNDQSNARVRIVNSGAGGGKNYDLVAGTPGASNAGFAIHNQTDGVVLAQWTAAGALTTPSTITAANGGIISSSPGDTLHPGSMHLRVTSGAGFAYFAIGNGNVANSHAYIAGASGLLAFGFITDGSVTSEFGRMQTGVFAWGTTVTVSAVAGNIVVPNNVAYCAVNAAGDSTTQLMWLDASNRLTLNTVGGALAIANPSTSGVATAGAVALPANPAGFLPVILGGTTYKLPYYNS